MTIQEVINSLNNSVKYKSEKIRKDINGNLISTTEVINSLQSIQKDNEDDEDYSYLNDDEYMSLGDIEDMMW